MTLTDRQRERMVSIADYLISKAPVIDYEAVRPMLNYRKTYSEARRILNSGGHLAMDCSESVTLICKWAGVKSPSGPNYGFNGFGNSHTMWSYLSQRYTNPEDAHPGALVVFGPEGDEHVCMVIARNGDNPILFSHGSEIGPLRIDLASESAAHSGQPRAFLNVAKL